jgi:hypothetical protein
VYNKYRKDNLFFEEMKEEKGETEQKIHVSFGALLLIILIS